jgi:hypothetical protein
LQKNESTFDQRFFAAPFSYDPKQKILQNNNSRPMEKGRFVNVCLGLKPYIIEYLTFDYKVEIHIFSAGLR